MKGTLPGGSGSRMGFFCYASGFTTSTRAARSGIPTGSCDEKQAGRPVVRYLFIRVFLVNLRYFLGDFMLRIEHNRAYGASIQPTDPVWCHTLGYGQDGAGYAAEALASRHHLAGL